MQYTRPEPLLNPTVPVEVSPTEYEKQIVGWLEAADTGLTSFRVVHPAKQEGSSGMYAFDAVAEFQVDGGVKMLVLIECVRHTDPAKLYDLTALEGKQRDFVAQKAMLFSTAGFQSDALQYAGQRGIATIVFIDSKLTYSAFDQGPVEYPPDMPKFSGLLISASGNSGGGEVVSDEYPQAFKEWVMR